MEGVDSWSRPSRRFGGLAPVYDYLPPLNVFIILDPVGVPDRGLLAKPYMEILGIVENQCWREYCNTYTVLLPDTKIHEDHLTMEEIVEAKPSPPTPRDIGGLVEELMQRAEPDDIVIIISSGRSMDESWWTIAERLEYVNNKILIVLGRRLDKLGEGGWTVLTLD